MSAKPILTMIKSGTTQTVPSRIECFRNHPSNYKKDISMGIQNYHRIPFNVEAVQVTPENRQEVAEWCGGTVDESKAGHPIDVPTFKPISSRHTTAFEKDWVVKSELGFKVYTPAAFDASFAQKV